MAPQIAEFIDEGIVNIIGGCCGTSPEFIAHYARSAEGKKPHQVVEKPKYMWLSGLDLLQVDGNRCLHRTGGLHHLRLLWNQS